MFTSVEQNFVSLDESVKYVKSDQIILLVLKNKIFLITLFILWLKIILHSWIRRTENKRHLPEKITPFLRFQQDIS